MSTGKHDNTKSPLRWDQLERWLDFGGSIGDWRKTRMDRRLFTIAPAFEGVMDGLKGYSHRVPAATQTQILAVAARTVGTYDPALDYRRDSLRRRVVLDWAVRSALPRWVERLPMWSLSSLGHPTAFANELREHKKLLWVSEIGDVVHLLTTAWIRIEDDIKAWRAQDEYALLVDVQERLGILLQMLSDTMTELFGACHNNNQNHDAWVCSRVLRALGDGEFKASTVEGAQAAKGDVVATVSTLIDALLATAPNDSQRGAAERCEWPDMIAKKSARCAPETRRTVTARVVPSKKTA